MTVEFYIDTRVDLKTVFPHEPLRTTLRTPDVGMLCEFAQKLHNKHLIKLRIQRTKYLGAKRVLLMTPV